MQARITRRISLGVLAGLALTRSSPSRAEARDLNSAARAEGMLPDRLRRLDAHFADAVARRERAGYVLMIGRHGRLVHAHAVGLRDMAAGSPMELDTRFRIASLTKLITSVAVMQLVEDGRVQLNDPVARYLPEIGAMQVAASPAEPDTLRAPVRAMTIRDLLIHVSGLGYRFDSATPLGRRYRDLDLFHQAGDLGQAIDRLASLPLYSDPGERIQYSYSVDVLGRLVEAVLGESLGAVLRRRVFEPLGMAGTTFHPSPDLRPRLATNYGRDDQGDLVALTEEVFGDPFDPNRWESGGAGLISTGPDYLRFLMMMERGGILDGARILSPATVARMTRDHLPPTITARLAGTPLAGMGFGLGAAVVTDADQAAGQFRDGDYLWSGHFDTQYFVSPSSGLAAVVMTQFQEAPGAPPSRTAADFRALVYGALAS